MTYVLAAYGITIALLAGYAVSVFARRRAAAREARLRPPRES